MFKVRLSRKVRRLLVPQAVVPALSHVADPIGQPQTEMVGEPWCNFLQHLPMRFAWCSPMRRLPTRKMFTSLLISVTGFATAVIFLTILGTTLPWTNATFPSTWPLGLETRLIIALTCKCELSMWIYNVICPKYKSLPHLDSLQHTLIKHSVVAYNKNTNVTTPVRMLTLSVYRAHFIYLL